MSYDSVDVCDKLYEMLENANVKFKDTYEDDDGYEDLWDALEDIKIIKKNNKGNTYRIFAISDKVLRDNDANVSEILTDIIPNLDYKKDIMCIAVDSNLKELKQLYKTH
jgi:hypothetical protein